MNNYTCIRLTRIILQLVIMSSMVAVSDASEPPVVVTKKKKNVRKTGIFPTLGRKPKDSPPPLSPTVNALTSPRRMVAAASNSERDNKSVGKEESLEGRGSQRRADGTSYDDPGSEPSRSSENYLHEVEEDINTSPRLASSWLSRETSPRDCAVDGMTELHRVASEGAENTINLLSRMNLLLIAGTINKADRDNLGRVALHYAAINGKLEVFRRLITHDYGLVHTMTRDYEGKLPLHYACKYGHESIVKYILDNNVDTIEEGDIKKITLFLAGNDDFEKVKERVYAATKQELRDSIDNELGRREMSSGKELLELAFEKELINPRYYLKLTGFSDTNCFDSKGNTPLHLAALGNYVAVMKLLRGSNVDACDNDKRTPLHVSYAQGHFAASRYLLAKKWANCNAQDKDGRTPLHLAAAGGKDGHDTVLQNLLLQMVTTKQGLVDTTSDGFVSIDEETSDSWRQQAEPDTIEFYLTMQERSDKTPPYLTNLNAEDVEQKTALHIALENGHLEFAICLIEFPEVLVNVCDNKDTTPLHHACFKGLKKIVGLLIKRGANPNIQDAKGQTTLHKAVLSESMHGDDRKVIVDFLLRQPPNNQSNKKIVDIARVITEDKLGCTALHYAAKLGLIDIVRVILKRTISAKRVFNERDNDGKTALELAQIEKLAIEEQLNEREMALKPTQLEKLDEVIKYLTSRDELREPVRV